MPDPSSPGGYFCFVISIRNVTVDRQQAAAAAATAAKSSFLRVFFIRCQPPPSWPFLSVAVVTCTVIFRDPLSEDEVATFFLVIFGGRKADGARFLSCVGNRLYISITDNKESRLQYKVSPEIHHVPYTRTWQVTFYPNVTTLRSGLCCRRSVCLSVTLVHPTQGVEAFGDISSPLCTLAIL